MSAPSARRGPIALAAVLALLAPGMAAGYKRRPSYDQSTPDAALDSLFDALRKRRLPADLELLIADPDEVELWRLQCKHLGCRDGRHQVVEREVAGARAVLAVTFEVTGDHGARIMGGERARVELARFGERWMVQRIGQPLRIPLEGGVPQAPEPPAPGP